MLVYFVGWATVGFVSWRRLPAGIYLISWLSCASSLLQTSWGAFMQVIPTPGGKGGGWPTMTPADAAVYIHYIYLYIIIYMLCIYTLSFHVFFTEANDCFKMNFLCNINICHAERGLAYISFASPSNVNCICVLPQKYNMKGSCFHFFLWTPTLI